MCIRDRRPSDGVEYPMQSWVRLGNLTVINDGKFAYDALDSRLRITLLRLSLIHI